LPFLIFIEFLSYFFRFISLSLRLFANILAGHILIHVLTAAVLKTVTGEFIDLLLGGLVYFAFIILFFFEMIVGFLQGYILFILSVIYLTDLENNTH
jgi:F0F1-type ATP synthase membrane subunit a